MRERKYRLRSGTRTTTEYLVPGVDRFDASLLAALLFVGGYVFYVGLGDYPLWGWDEGVYATAAYHAVDGGHWLIPHTYWIVNNSDVTLQPFLHKPPLVVWLEALSMSVFGVNVFAARLPSATAAVATGVVLYFLGRRTKSRLTGFLAAVVWYTTPGVYASLNGGRFAATDAVFTFFGTLFVALTWLALSEDRPALLIPACLAAAGTVMAKGFAAGIFVLIVLPLVVRYWRTLASREFGVGVAAFVVVALPWYLVALLRYGDRFVREAIVAQVVGRAAGENGVETPGAVFEFMRYPYFENFFSLFDPWVYWLLPGLVAVWVLAYRRSDRDGLASLAFLTYWAAIVLGFFAVFGNHQWYVIPMYVPCALLVGWTFDEAADWNPIAVGSVAVGTGLLVLFSPRFADVSPLATPDYPGLPGGVWSDVLTGVAFAAVLVAFLAVVLVVRRVQERRVPVLSHDAVRLVVPVVVAAVLVVAFVSPPASTGTLLANQHELGTTADESVPGGETVYIQNSVPYSSNLFPYEFYSRHATADKSLRGLLTDESVEYALVRGAAVSDLRRPHEVLSEKPIQTGNGPRNVALVHFTGSLAEYDPSKAPLSPVGPNLVTNPGFANGTEGWWTPSGDGVTGVSVTDGDDGAAAVLSTPAGGKRLPIAQQVEVREGRQYHLDVDADGAVAANLYWYDGEKSPENLVASRSVAASELPATVEAKGSHLSIRLRPRDDRVTVRSVEMRRAERRADDPRRGTNHLRNGEFDDGLRDWWHSTGDDGTQVSVDDGTVTMETAANERSLPLAQRAVVSPGANYRVNASVSGDAVVKIAWFEDARASTPTSTDTMPADELPAVVESNGSVVAVRIFPEDETVTVDSVSVYRTANGTASST